MQTKTILVFFCLCVSGILGAQELNGYKYVVVPQIFEFQKSADKYQLNSLTEFLFTKKGFKALMANEKQPEDLYNNPCLALRADLVDNSNILSTKLIINLKNCSDEIVFTSDEGKSRIKDFKKAHQEALRQAFRSIQAIDYSFDRKLVQTAKREQVVETKEEVLSEEPEQREEGKPTLPVSQEIADKEVEITTEAEKVQDQLAREKDTDESGKENTSDSKLVAHDETQVSNSPSL